VLVAVLACGNPGDPVVPDYNIGGCPPTDERCRNADISEALDDSGCTCT
jgi:hypothetical protein